MSAPTPPVIQKRPRSRDHTLTFYWTIPVSDGGSPVTGYTLSCVAASFSQAYSSTTFSTSVTGLTNATTYQFTLTAENGNGSSTPAPFRPCQPGLPAPAPPTVQATPIDASGSYLVTWTAPTLTSDMATIKRFFVEAFDLSSNSVAVARSTYGNQYRRYLPAVNLLHGHQFRVFSVNDNGYSPYTIPVATPALVSFTASSYSGSGAWHDDSGHGRNATIEFGTAAKNGVGNGIYLNGSTGWRFDPIGSQSIWSISIWFKRRGPSYGDACILTELFSGTTLNMAIICAGSPTDFKGGFFNGGFQVGAYQNFPLNTWKQMTVTWDGTYIRTYVNGALADTADHSGQTSQSASNNYYRIGCRWDSYEFVTGDLGELTIYPTALSGPDITAHYNATVGAYSS